MRKQLWVWGLCCCSWAGAQTLHVQGTLSGDKVQGVNLSMVPMEVDASRRVPLQVSGGQFEGEVPMASDGFYLLLGTTASGQLMAPLYLPGEAGGEVLPINLSGSCPQINLGADNQALSAFNALYYKNARELWMKGQEMSGEELLSFLKTYRQAADSIASHYHCSEPVKRYLAIWAYTVAADGYESLSRTLKGKLSFTLADLLEEPSQVLDVPMALYFPSAGSIISRSLPKGTLSERLAYLAAHYSCQPLRQEVAGLLLSAYIRSFDYARNFESGLAELTGLVERYALDTRYLKDFKARRASVKGTPFPAEVLLTDVEGNKVDFSQHYKGYYVYVDLWASWCGPCCREVPYLQQLEAELQNKQVKFVSISIDKGTKEWKAKMEALKMHGNQLINQDNTLADALNIAGIPHFLIYDKEGNLYQYNAPRPSSGEQLKALLEGLR